jgi:predicted DCC family thiol-disulfide oxidoreductase YuxK
VDGRVSLTLYTEEDPFEVRHGVYMPYHVIYDGNCNLCVTLVQLLEQLDQGERFDYIAMQNAAALAPLGITAQDCEQGMIVVNTEFPQQRWQGSDAAEQIGRILPTGKLFVAAYRALPGMKWMGDRTYAQIRDNRYTLFGKRSSTYEPRYPGCPTDNCRL